MKPSTRHISATIAKLFLIAVVLASFIVASPVVAQAPGTIKGYVYLQGRTDHSGVTVCVDTNGDGVGDICDPDGTDATGYFAIGGVPPGSGYAVTATMPGYLTARKTGVSVAADTTTTLRTITLVGGDAVPDNVINIADLIKVADNFGLTVPPGEAAADIISDNLVDVLDLVKVGIHFGEAGPTTWGRPPVADADGPYVSSNDPNLRAYVTVEGFPVTLDASGSYDPDGTIVLYEGDVNNDGTYDLVGATPIGQYTYSDDYEGPVVLRVTDDDGLTDTDTAWVICLNEPPVVDAGGDLTASAGTEVNFSADFYDPGNDNFSYSWDFGDGTSPVTGTVTGETPGLHPLTTTHTYAVAGTYTVTLTVTDDDGGTSANAAVAEVSSGGGASSLALPPLAATTSATTTPRPSVVGVCWVELTQTPGDWLPRYVNRVSHTATIQNRPPQIISFMLMSSDEPGYCMNRPQPTQTWAAGPDLRFIQDHQTDPNILVVSPTAAITRQPVQSATIVTTSFDYGSYGCLHALTKDCVGAAALIPFDADGNRIADGWAFNAGGAADDLDANPVGDRQPGDGFTRYEEYRGFEVHHAHIRTSPDDKNLFIRDENNALTNYRGDVPQLGVQVHWIDNDEWQNGTTRIVNYNNAFAHALDQRALRLTDGGRGLVWNADDGRWEMWWGGTWRLVLAVRWVPNNVDPCRVYTGHIRDNWPPPPPAVSPAGAPPEDGVITRTVAHELAHGVNLDDDNVGAAPPPPHFIMTEFLPAGWPVGHAFRGGAGNGTLSQLRLVP